MDTKIRYQVIHLCTNVGSKITQMQAMIQDYGKVRYDDNAIAHVLSLTNLVRKYIVTYDSHQDDAFYDRTNKGIIKFRRNKQGIYVFNTTYNTENPMLSPQRKEIW